MTRVMVAIDGTDLDQKLAATAHELFGDDADYWAVNVQVTIGARPGTFPVAYGGAYAYAVPEVYVPRAGSETPDAIGDEAQRRAQKSAEGAGLDDAQVIAEIGDPADAIRRAARAHDADVIVIGTHDRSWWSRLVEPSVSRSLTDEAPVPVLLITDSA